MINLKKLILLAQAIFDVHRLQIIKLLQIREMCVCELAKSLGLSSPRMSQHLAELRRAHVVKERREGKWIYYSLAPKTLEEFQQAFVDLLSQPVDGIPEMKAIWKRFVSSDLDQVKLSCGKRKRNARLKKL